jgi:hypothetical protein
MFFLLLFWMTIFKNLFSQGVEEKILYEFLTRYDGDTINFIRVQALNGNLDYPIIDKEMKLFNGGIYEFYDVRSHSAHYLFIYENNVINIIDDYSIKNILDIYWKRKEKIKNNNMRLKLLEGLSNYIYQDAVNNLQSVD